MKPAVADKMISHYLISESQLARLKLIKMLHEWEEVGVSRAQHLIHHPCASQINKAMADPSL